MRVEGREETSERCDREIGTSSVLAWVRESGKDEVQEKKKKRKTRRVVMGRGHAGVEPSKRSVSRVRSVSPPNENRQQLVKEILAQSGPIVQHAVERQMQSASEQQYYLEMQVAREMKRLAERYQRRIEAQMERDRTQKVQWVMDRDSWETKAAERLKHGSNARAHTVDGQRISYSQAKHRGARHRAAIDASISLLQVYLIYY